MKKVMTLILLGAALVIPNGAYGFFGRGMCCNSCTTCEMSRTTNCGCKNMNDCGR